MFGTRRDITLIAPHPYGLSDSQTDDLFKRQVLPFGEFLGLLQHWLWYFGFDRCHIICCNSCSIRAGMIASIPNFSTPAKFLELWVTIYFALEAMASSKMK